MISGRIKLKFAQYHAKFENDPKLLSLKLNKQLDPAI